jgi:hypothetical protein
MDRLSRVGCWGGLLKAENGVSEIEAQNRGGHGGRAGRKD